MDTLYIKTKTKHPYNLFHPIKNSQGFSDAKNKIEIGIKY